jgi:hypothetical protein
VLMRLQATTNHVDVQELFLWNRLTIALGTGLDVPRCPTFRRAQMGKVNDENVRTGQQETNEPWKKPDHSDHHPDKTTPSPRPRRAEDNKTS